MPRPLEAVAAFAVGGAFLTACVLAQDLGSTGGVRGPFASDDPDAAGASEETRPDGDGAGPGTGEPPVGARVDGGADGADGAGGVDAAMFGCDSAIDVGQLQPSTCAFVDPVSNRVGRVKWVCGGGPAQLTLGTLTLDGTVTGNQLKLSACRDDPSANFSGHFETVEIDVDLGAKAGSLSYARATGLACPKVFTDCSATTGVDLLP